MGQMQPCGINVLMGSCCPITHPLSIPYLTSYSMPRPSPHPSQQKPLQLLFVLQASLLTPSNSILQTRPVSQLNSAASFTHLYFYFFFIYLSNYTFVISLFLALNFKFLKWACGFHPSYLSLACLLLSPFLQHTTQFFIPDFVLAVLMVYSIFSCSSTKPNLQGLTKNLSPSD